MNKLIFSFCLIFASQLFAQEFSPMKAPDVIAFTNANYMPIDESTGRVGVTVPIYTIDLDGMEIPISISYETGGVKVNAPASNVGLNWTLNATGLINKEIQGYEDIKVSGGFNDNAPTGYLYTSYGYLRHLLNFPNDPGHAISQPFRDTQPDFYYAMAPGLNTKFTHRFTGDPFEFTNQNTKILTPFKDPYQMYDPYWRTRLKPGFNFKLIPTNGYEYSFEDYGFHHTYNANTEYNEGPLLDQNLTYEEFLNIITPTGPLMTVQVHDLFPTIHLSSIKNPITKRKIEYEYIDNILVDNSRFKRGSYIKDNGIYVGGTPVADLIVEKSIKKIIFPDGVVNFYYDYNRLDIKSGIILKKIEVLNNYGELIKAVVFEQDYFSSLENCTDNNCYRLRLNGVTFLDKDNNVLPGYGFQYNATKLPKRFSLDQDFTGYYNGSSGIADSQHFPKSYFKAGQGDRSIIPFPSTGYALLNASLANVDKTANLTYSKAASLEKITYPTGGHTKFDYELHSFSFQNATVNAGGLRLKKQSMFDMDNNLLKEINYDYNLENGLTSGSITNIPKYTKAKTLNDIYDSGTNQNVNTKLELTNGAFITYSKVRIEELNNGYIVNNYTNANDFPNEEPEEYTLHGNFTTFPSWMQENIENGYYPYIHNDYSIKRGKLLSSKFYDNSNNLLKSITNEYEYKSYESFGISENHIFKMPNFAYTTGNNARYVRFQASLNSESNFLKRTLTTEYTDSGTLTNEKTNWYDSNLPFLKESLTIVNDAETRKERIYYPFDSEVSSLPNIGVLNALNMVVPIKKEYFSNNELLATSLTSYHDFGANKIMPSKESASKKNNPLEVKVNFENYDRRGNVIEYKQEDGMTVSVLWAYDYQYKIAEVLNATYSEVLTALGVTDTKHLQTKTNSQLEMVLANLRTNLPNAQVYSYIHSPGVGVLSITDPRGRKNTYEYDGFKRLTSIKDHEGKVLAENKYNYKSNPSVTIPDIGPLVVAIEKSATPDYVPDPAPSTQYTVLSAMTSGGRGDYSYEWREEGSSTIVSTAYKYTAEVPCSTNKTYNVTVTDLNDTSINETVTVNAPNCGEAFYLGPIYGQSSTNNQNHFWVDPAEGADFGIFKYVLFIVDDTSGFPTPSLYTTHFRNNNASVLVNTSGNPVTVTIGISASNVKSGYTVTSTRVVTIQPEFEINSCFVAGTKIKMADGSEKNIEEVTKGDKVLTYNTEKEKIEVGEVLNMVNPIHTKMIQFSFENGIKNTNTLDHPYYVKDKGWASFNPDLTRRNYDLEVEKMEKGDVVFLHASKGKKLKPIKLMEYELLDKEQTTYNLDKVSVNHNFFANGILVHNKSPFTNTNPKN